MRLAGIAALTTRITRAVKRKATVSQPLDATFACGAQFGSLRRPWRTEDLRVAYNSCLEHLGMSNWQGDCLASSRREEAARTATTLRFEARSRPEFLSEASTTGATWWPASSAAFRHQQLSA